MTNAKIKTIDDLPVMSDIQTASTVIGRAVRTLRADIRDGRLRVFRAVPNGKILISRDEIERYLNDNQM